MAYNLVGGEHKHSLRDGQIFKALCLLIMELWFSKFIELNVCGIPLFANPVTYINTVNVCSVQCLVPCGKHVMSRMYWSTSHSSDELREEPRIILKFVLRITTKEAQEWTEKGGVLEL